MVLHACASRSSAESRQVGATAAKPCRVTPALKETIECRKMAAVIQATAELREVAVVTVGLDRLAVALLRAAEK